MREELAQEASAMRGRLGLQGAGWVRATTVYLLLLGIFGVILPWERGRGFLDSIILGAYACLGVVFAAPAAALGFDQYPTARRALARVAIAVFYGELAAGAMLL